MRKTLNILSGKHTIALVCEQVNTHAVKAYELPLTPENFELINDRFEYNSFEFRTVYINNDKVAYIDEIYGVYYTENIYDLILEIVNDLGE